MECLVLRRITAYLSILDNASPLNLSMGKDASLTNDSLAMTVTQHRRGNRSLVPVGEIHDVAG